LHGPEEALGKALFTTTSSGASPPALPELGDDIRKSDAPEIVGNNLGELEVAIRTCRDVGRLEEVV
jgi:hypothetical protein